MSHTRAVERDGMGRMGPPAHPSHGDIPKEGETWVLSASPSVAGAEVSLGADVWGWAPSTVTHGMAKCWTQTSPCWVNSAAACRSRGQCGVPGTCTHCHRV